VRKHFTKEKNLILNELERGGAHGIVVFHYSD